MSSQRWSIRFAKGAKADLREILAWSREHFGVQQTRQYAKTIDDAVQALYHGPEVPGSRPRDDIAPGLRSLHVARKGRRGRHVLVYRATGDHLIEVARIHHERMDVSSQPFEPDP